MEIIEKLKENVEIILPENGLEEKLKLAKEQNRPLRIKLGFDPTAPDLHLGHAVVLKKIRQFQDLGHQIVILVGSFTAQIGDPTGKNKARKPLSAEDVAANAKTYIDQLSQVIDVAKAKVVFNSDWLDKLSFSDVIQILGKVTVAQLMHRNDFNKRFTEQSPIGMHELVYPILQGYDSVEIKCDIEMGGTDQLFNCTMGRQLQESYAMPAQIVMCMPLLKGLDGKEKMSKSLNNIIGLTDAPEEMFGKTMSIPDAMIGEFLDLATDFAPAEKAAHKLAIAEGENPMAVKKLIAKNIITQYHSAEAATAAEEFFATQFQNKAFDEKIFEPFAISSLVQNDAATSLIELCAQLKTDITKSAMRRLISSGAVQVDNEKELDANKVISLQAGLRIRIGKRDYFELVG